MVRLPKRQRPLTRDFLTRVGRGGAGALRRALPIALGVALTWPGAAHARPDPAGALRSLVQIPLQVTGDALAGAGLIAGAALGLAGDALSYVDENPATTWALEGRLHGAVHELAHALSRLGTGSFERLRGIDVERWPEPATAYHAALPGAGRLDTAWSGVLAVALSPFDVGFGVLLAASQAAGAKAQAEDTERAWRERRIRLVGPTPPPEGPESESHVE